MTEEELKVMCKFYLTILSARAAHYCYFNFRDNKVILCNSTTSTTARHGDRLMDFSVGELGLHLIEFRDRAVIPAIKKLLHIPEKQFYGIHIVNFMKDWNKCTFDELPIEFTKDQLFLNGKLCGSIIYNFHVIMMLDRYACIMESIMERDNVIEAEVDIHPELTGNYYMISVDTGLFYNYKGERVFRDVVPKMNIPCIDGLTTVSFKSFLPKVKEDYEIKRYFWNEDIRIYSITYYSDSNVIVKSFRPNILSIPIANITSMDKEN